MNFINQTEMAAFADNAARTEVTQSGGATVVYGGTPDIDDPSRADQGEWTICRTTVRQQNGTTLVETAWAKGRWDERASLTYKYQ